MFNKAKDLFGEVLFFVEDAVSKQLEARKRRKAKRFQDAYRKKMQIAREHWMRRADENTNTAYADVVLNAHLANQQDEDDLRLRCLQNIDDPCTLADIVLQFTHRPPHRQFVHNAYSLKNAAFWAINNNDTEALTKLALEQYPEARSRLQDEGLQEQILRKLIQRYPNDNDLKQQALLLQKHKMTATEYLSKELALLEVTQPLNDLSTSLLHDGLLSDVISFLFERYPDFDLEHLERTTKNPAGLSCQISTSVREEDDGTYRTYQYLGILRTGAEHFQCYLWSDSRFTEQQGADSTY